MGQFAAWCSETNGSILQPKSRFSPITSTCMKTVEKYLCCDKSWDANLRISRTPFQVLQQRKCIGRPSQRINSRNHSQVHSHLLTSYSRREDCVEPDHLTPQLHVCRSLCNSTAGRTCPVGILDTRFPCCGRIRLESIDRKYEHRVVFGDVLTDLVHGHASPRDFSVPLSQCSRALYAKRL
jgi:hypothetical protein